MDKKVELIINRNFNLFAVLMRTKVQFFNDSNQLESHFYLWSGQSKTVMLPKTVTAIKCSTKTILGREVYSQKNIYADIFDKVQVSVTIANINILAIYIPFLALTVPVYDYKIQIRYISNDDNKPTMKNKYPYKLYTIVLGLIFQILAYLSLFFAVLFFMTLLAGNISLSNVNNWALEGTDIYVLESYEKIGGVIGVWIATFLFYILFRTFITLRNKMKRKKCTFDINNENYIFNKNTPYILYLRSFDDDIVTKKNPDQLLKPFQTEESILVNILSDIAPVIAFGRQGDKYLPDGATRIYASNDAWKDYVTDLADNAEIIALRIGDTKSLKWEIDMCLKQMEYKKLLFIIPASRNFNIAKELYREMLQKGINIEYFDIEIKKRSKGSIAGFVYFDEKNEPQFIKLKTNSFISFFIPFEDSVRETIYVFTQAFGLSYNKMKINLKAKLLWATSLIFVIFMVINSFYSYIDFTNDRYPKEIIEHCEQRSDIAKSLKDNSDYAKILIIFSNALKGINTISPEKRLYIYNTTTDLYNAMSIREYELMFECVRYDFINYPKNILIIAKKYLEEDEYDKYISILNEAALNYFSNPIDTRSTIDDSQIDIILQHLNEIPNYNTFSSLNIESKREVELSVRYKIFELYNEGYDVLPLIDSNLIYTYPDSLIIE